jgi:hypothetical protein
MHGRGSDVPEPRFTAAHHTEALRMKKPAGMDVGILVT